MIVVKLLLRFWNFHQQNVQTGYGVPEKEGPRVMMKFGLSNARMWLPTA